MRCMNSSRSSQRGQQMDRSRQNLEHVSIGLSYAISNRLETALNTANNILSTTVTNAIDTAVTSNKMMINEIRNSLPTLIKEKLLNRQPQNRLNAIQSYNRDLMEKIILKRKSVFQAKEQLSSITRELENKKKQVLQAAKSLENKKRQAQEVNKKLLDLRFELQRMKDRLGKEKQLNEAYQNQLLQYSQIYKSKRKHQVSQKKLNQKQRHKVKSYNSSSGKKKSINPSSINRYQPVIRKTK